MRRQILNLCRTFQTKAMDDSVEAITLLEDIENELIIISGIAKRTEPKLLRVALNEFQDKLEEVRAGVRKYIGLETGYTRLDAMLGGMDNDLYIVAGTPSMGKTAFVLNVVEKISEKHPALFFSLESSIDNIATRLITLRSGIPSQRIRNARFYNDEYTKFREARENLSSRKVFIDDNACLSTFDFKSKLRKMMGKHEIKIVFIDYLQLMQLPKADSRNDAIGSVTRQLKIAAKEYGVPIVVLSQLNRELFKRADKRPQLSDLRDSGNIEADAYGVWFVHRPAFAGLAAPAGTKEEDWQKAVEIIVAKNKDGETGAIEMVFIKQNMKFQELAPSGIIAPPESHYEPVRDENEMPF
jgi:replicative DNA helicase